MANIAIPVEEIGEVKIIGDFACEVAVPLATYETPLWPSVKRGALVSRKTEGISVSVISDCMTRSVVLESDNVGQILEFHNSLLLRKEDLQKEVSKTSSYAKLLDIDTQIVGNLIYIRFKYNTGDASGHNMTTKASDALINWICKEYPYMRYVSVSANYCTDKKVSAVNGILGRGKNVTAEIIVPKKLCSKILKTTPEKIVNINNKKNLIGSILAGGVRSANAHYANMLLAFYLATGQDAANIVEGSQGITYASLTKEGDLYFSVNCPNIIIGTVGNGKEFNFVREYLTKMGCLDKKSSVGVNSKKLAAIATATVLCGELSLLAAQTNQGELMEAHERLERRRKS